MCPVQSFNCEALRKAGQSLETQIALEGTYLRAQLCMAVADVHGSTTARLCMAARPGVHVERVWTCRMVLIIGGKWQTCVLPAPPHPGAPPRKVNRAESQVIPLEISHASSAASPGLRQGIPACWTPAILQEGCTSANDGDAMLAQSTRWVLLIKRCGGGLTATTSFHRLRLIQGHVTLCSIQFYKCKPCVGAHIPVVTHTARNPTLLITCDRTQLQLRPARPYSLFVARPAYTPVVCLAVIHSKPEDRRPGAEHPGTHHHHEHSGRTAASVLESSCGAQDQCVDT